MNYFEFQERKIGAKPSPIRSSDILEIDDIIVHEEPLTTEAFQKLRDQQLEAIRASNQVKR